MNYGERNEIAKIRAFQQNRIAIQSWDYININDPKYPELVVHKTRLEEIIKRPASVEEVRKDLERKEYD